MTERVPTCVWRISDALLLALDDAFGEPTDTYVNGSQVWLLDNGPAGATLEWRLHPAPGFKLPAGTTAFELLASVVWDLRAAAVPAVPIDSLWEGLEAFPAFVDEVEPAPLAATVTETIGIAPDAFGAVDHTPIGDAWEHSQRTVSVIEMLFEQLRPE